MGRMSGIACIALAVLMLIGCGRPSRAPNSSGAAPQEVAPDPNKLSEAQLSELIIVYEHGFCAWNTYSYRYDANYDNVRNFFQQQLNAGFLSARSPEQGFGATGQVFDYTDKYRIPSIAQFWWEPPYEIRVKDCMYVPSAVRILDTSYDTSGKRATVTFRNTESELTEFGKKFASYRGSPEPRQMWLGDSKPANTVEIDNVELVANLQKLDATGWRVNGVQRSR